MSKRNSRQDNNQNTRHLAFKQYHPQNVDISEKYETWGASSHPIYFTITIQQTNSPSKSSQYEYEVGFHSKKKPPKGLNENNLPKGRAKSFEDAKNRIKYDFDLNKIFPQEDLSDYSNVEIVFSKKSIHNGYPY